jgi:hypothetical protein
MPSITRSSAHSTSTSAERLNLRPDPTRTASRNTDGAADAGRPRVPEAVKAAGRESGSGRSDGGSGVGRVPTGANGLVICAKSVRDTVDDGVVRNCRPRMPWGCGSRAPIWLPRQRHCLSRPNHGRTDGTGSAWNRSPGDSGSRWALAWSASAGPVPFGRRKHRSEQSTATDSM